MNRCGDKLDLKSFGAGTYAMAMLGLLNYPPKNRYRADLPNTKNVAFMLLSFKASSIISVKDECVVLLKTLCPPGINSVIYSVESVLSVSAG
jgi:hypothetical protein